MSLTMALKASLKWLLRVSLAAVKWVILHPGPAFAVGVGLLLAGQWLSRQSFAGAKPLSRMAGVTGEVLAYTGLGVGVVHAVIAAIPWKWGLGIIGAAWGIYDALSKLAMPGGDFLIGPVDEHF